jgi:hypothetical protein
MEPQNTQNTQMDTDEGGVNPLSKRIIGCALTVLHTLGTGFLERVYENALVRELRKSGLAVSQQHPMVVRYDESGECDRRDSSRAVPELSESHRLAPLPASQLRQTSARDQTHRPGAVGTTPFACSA